MCMRMWCIGKIIKKVTHGLANFSAKFEIDEASSLLTLNSADYDISPDADYNAWMILEPVGEAAETEAVTEAVTADDAATHGEASAAVGMEA